MSPGNSIENEERTGKVEGRREGGVDDGGSDRKEKERKK